MPEATLADNNYNYIFLNCIHKMSWYSWLLLSKKSLGYWEYHTPITFQFLPWHFLPDSLNVQLNFSVPSSDALVTGVNSSKLKSVAPCNAKQQEGWSCESWLQVQGFPPINSWLARITLKVSPFVSPPPSAPRRHRHCNTTGAQIVK